MAYRRNNEPRTFIDEDTNETWVEVSEADAETLDSEGVEVVFVVREDEIEDDE